MSLFSPLGGQIGVCPKSERGTSGMLAGWFVMPQFLDHVAGEAKRAVMWIQKAQGMSSLEMS